MQADVELQAGRAVLPDLKDEQPAVGREHGGQSIVAGLADHLIARNRLGKLPETGALLLHLVNQPLRRDAVRRASFHLAIAL